MSLASSCLPGGSRVRGSWRTNSSSRRQPKGRRERFNPKTETHPINYLFFPESRAPRIVPFRSYPFTYLCFPSCCSSLSFTLIALTAFPSPGIVLCRRRYAHAPYALVLPLRRSFFLFFARLSWFVSSTKTAAQGAPGCFGALTQSLTTPHSVPRRFFWLSGAARSPGFASSSSGKKYVGLFAFGFLYGF